MNKNENKVFFPRKVIYYEKQKNDRLCGLHALNSLLQGPYFDVGQLTEIGLGLNEMERQIMGSHDSSNENVDDDGNYNVQVLTEALKIFGAELVTINTKKLILMLNQDVEAILFNSSTHWFTIRKIEGIWFNLNSTNVLPGPEIISDFYLSAFIQGTVDAGYTNFLVKNLPLLASTNSDIYKNLDEVEKRLINIEEVLKAKEAKSANNKNKNGKKEEKEDAKFKAFQGQGVSLHDEHHNNFGDNDLDEETRKAIEMSLNDYMGNIEKNIKKEPEENDPNCYTISFKTADQTFTRRFYPEDTIGDMVDYLKVQTKTSRTIEIFEMMPRKIYTDYWMKIKDAHLSKKQFLMARII